jgi:hypothetical protein
VGRKGDNDGNESWEAINNQLLKLPTHLRAPDLWSPVPFHSLSLFVDAGKQTKPICFFSKGRSGLSGKANIEGCLIVSGGNMGVLFWAKRHPCRMSVGQRFGVIHGRPSCWPRRIQPTLCLEPKFLFVAAAVGLLAFLRMRRSKAL